MKTIYMTLAAVSALAVTAPVAAQSWSGSRADTGQLQARFDAGVQTGAISRNEARPLRAQLRQLMQLERQYSRAGFNAWERSALRERSRTLSMDIAAAARSGYGRSDRFGAGIDARNDGYARNDGKDDAMLSGYADHRGDRFAGDVRVGQHFSDRQIALPIQYRERYRDSDAAYYRYDNDRVYRIDRNTGVILAMFDIAG